MDRKNTSQNRFSVRIPIVGALGVVDLILLPQLRADPFQYSDFGLEQDQYHRASQLIVESHGSMVAWDFYLPKQSEADVAPLIIRSIWNRPLAQFEWGEMLSNPIVRWEDYEFTVSRKLVKPNTNCFDRYESWYKAGGHPGRIEMDRDLGGEPRWHYAFTVSVFDDQGLLAGRYHTWLDRFTESVDIHIAIIAASDTTLHDVPLGTGYLEDRWAQVADRPGFPNAWLQADKLWEEKKEKDKNRPSLPEEVWSLDMSFDALDGYVDLLLHVLFTGGNAIGKPKNLQERESSKLLRKNPYLLFSFALHGTNTHLTWDFYCYDPYKPHQTNGARYGFCTGISRRLGETMSPALIRTTIDLGAVREKASQAIHDPELLWEVILEPVQEYSTINLTNYAIFREWFCNTLQSPPGFLFEQLSSGKPELSVSLSVNQPQYTEVAYHGDDQCQCDALLRLLKFIASCDEIGTLGSTDPVVRKYFEDRVV